MKKKITSVILAALICTGSLVSLISCVQEGDKITNIISDAVKEENKNFESRKIPVIAESDSNVEKTVFIRIYDENEYVPYVGLAYWLKEMCSAKVSDISYSDSKYRIMTTSSGKLFPLEVNTKNSTIYCPSRAGLTDLDQKLFFAENTEAFIIKTIFTGQKSITFDLAKYGFKIYGGLDDVYIPLCVANQLFTCTMTMEQYLYNGEKLYKNKDDVNYKTFKNGPWYTKNSEGELNPRPKELAEVSYQLLCFTHDYIYGRPGYYGFADNKDGYAKADVVAEADKLSFDELLKQKDPTTLDMLKSLSYAEYLAGLQRLTVYDYGDMHSAFVKKENDFFLLDNEDVKIALYFIGASRKKKYDDAKEEELGKLRKAAGIADSEGKLIAGKEIEFLDDDKKTLVIRFDSFEINEEEWAKYYSGNPSAMPDPASTGFPTDCMGLFYKAFYYIQRDKKNESGDYANVKTVLIDDSCNRGGAKFALQYILELISGSGEVYYDDWHTSARYHEIFNSDLNHDGKVNEDDKTYRKAFDSLNIGILTSFNSFSSGNAFPFFARERPDKKIKIFGERSGGGSCVAGVAVTADGFPFSFSINMRLCSADFSKTAEGGAEVDYPLEYEKFYDKTELLKALHDTEKGFGEY